MMQKIIYILVGTIVGTLSSMGLGGGSLMIPILYIFNYQQKEAQVINMLVYIPIALLGTMLNSKNELVDYKITRKIIIFGIVGAIVGAYIGRSIEGKLLKKIFGLAMIIFGVTQIRNK